MIKTKRKGRKGRDDVSFDLDDEKGEEEDEKVEKEREEVGEAYGKRERKGRDLRERDDRLRSTRSVNNTKADCGRG